MHNRGRVEGNAGQVGKGQTGSKRKAIGMAQRKEQHHRVNDIEQDRVVAGRGRAGRRTRRKAQQGGGQANGQGRLDGLTRAQNRVECTGQSNARHGWGRGRGRFSAGQGRTGVGDVAVTVAVAVAVAVVGVRSWIGAEQGRAGTATATATGAGLGRAGSDMEGQGRTGTGRAEHGMAGQDRIGQ